jgi:hypothetical protein
MAGRRQDRPEVFCGACRYFRETQRMDVCTHANAWYAVTTPVGVDVARHTPQERNADNDCADFQPRRWWWSLRPYRKVGGLLLLWAALYAVLLAWGGGKP